MPAAVKGDEEFWFLWMWKGRLSDLWSPTHAYYESTGTTKEAKNVLIMYVSTFWVAPRKKVSSEDTGEPLLACDSFRGRQMAAEEQPS